MRPSMSAQLPSGCDIAGAIDADDQECSNCLEDPSSPVSHNSRKPAVMGSRAARMPGSMPATKHRISP